MLGEWDDRLVLNTILGEVANNIELLNQSKLYYISTVVLMKMPRPFMGQVRIVCEKPALLS